MKRVLILSGGEKPGTRLLLKEKKAAGTIIAADTDLGVLKRLKVTPDTIIGDLDSVKDKYVGYFLKLGVEVIRLEVRKNETDTEAALDLAMKRGAEEIVILGGTGKRLDHTLGNIMLLKRAYDSGVKAYLKDRHTLIQVGTGKIEICGKNGEVVSLLPIGDGAVVGGVKGLFYPLDNLTLTNSHTRGVSNKMTGQKAVIDVAHGMVIVIQNK